MRERFTSRAALAAEIRNGGGVAPALATGLDAEQMPDNELREAWQRLTWVRHAYDDAMHNVEQHLADLAHRRPARPAEPVNPEDLSVGHTIYRYTEPARGLLETWVPCCGRIVRICPETCTHWAVCCACRMAYDLTLEDEADGGSLAVFTVAARQLIVAKHRGPPTRALSPPPQRPDAGLQR